MLLQVRAGARRGTVSAEGYRMFFLSTIAVAPNKFRPASKMGDMRSGISYSIIIPFVCTLLAADSIPIIGNTGCTLLRLATFGCTQGVP